ncbi:MAG: hypothetical protein IKY67_11810 [Paludibacteraceae bacterium]|nr:hypothetical protein [Paludibacteraceae bacterium]
MKRTKYLIIICLLAITPINSIKAQYANTLYFMNEIAERNNMNPAFTPSCNFYLDFIFLPNVYFSFGNDNFIMRDFIYNQNGKTQTFLSSKESLELFFKNLQPTTTINFNYNLNILSFGFQVKKSYFTFDLGLNMDVATYLPSDLLKFALYGTPDPNGINTFNLSQLGIDASLYSNAAIGYMYKINKQLTIGAKAKLLMGYANINTSINKLNLNASRQEWSLETDGTINASLPIRFNTLENGNIDFGSIQMNSANELLELLYNPAGIGAAIDLGIKYEPVKNLVISASVTDLGMIYWSRNSFSASMQGSHSIDELIDYTLGDTLSTDAIVDKFTGLGNEILNSMHTDGENKPYKSMLRGNFFLGAEYGILKNRISLGVVNRLKFKDTHLQDEVTVALNLRPIHWFNATVSHSFINGRLGTLGLGLNVKAGIMNMYIIADYIPTSYAQISLGDNALTFNDKTILSNVFIPNRTQMYNVQMGWTWNIGQHAKDTDQDGVKGRKDKCPETDMDFLRKQCPGLKKKQYVDKQGCDLDDDKDGVHNCMDLCPDTPEDTPVDQNGCPLESNNEDTNEDTDNQTL